MQAQWLAALLVCAGAGFAQQWEIGGDIGYGVYRDGTVYGAGTSVQAGVRDRFAAGALVSENRFDYISGELRYLYQDGHPFLSGAGAKTDIQGQSHTITYDILFHFRSRERRLRPYFAAGAGAKGYLIAGPEPNPQPIPKIATLVSVDQWEFTLDVGGGVKYLLRPHVLLRLDFRDYLTAFPSRQIAPASGNTARGIFQQFTPMFGVSYVF